MQGDVDVPVRPERNESNDRPPSTIRLPLVLGGLGFTAGIWGVNAGSAALSPDSPGFKYLRIPVVGPWLGLANNDCSGSCEFINYFNIVYFTVSGLAQAGGIGIALESLFTPTRAPGERPIRSVTPAPASPGPEGAPTGPAPAPAPTGPVEKRPSGPLFYLPMPITIGQGGAGVMFGGAF
ncbi:MAG: hypothetical protein EOO75_17285 [Myxococcales bacterium]|nr:MAG: hypothetical protein EOO75_17285 [Myxococcales bacterium]